MTPIINHDQNVQFNRKHGVVPRKLKAGDTVYAKVYQTNSKWKWASGIIIEAIGQVNYNVLLDDWHGRRKLIRSHANQIKHRFDEQTVPRNSTVPSPLSIFVDEFGLQENTENAQQNMVDVDASPDSEHNPEITKDDDEENEVQPEIEAPDVNPLESTQRSQPEVQSDEEPSTSRPKRIIQMPSRLEPFLVFWK